MISTGSITKNSPCSCESAGLANGSFGKNDAEDLHDVFPKKTVRRDDLEELVRDNRYL